MADVKNTTCLFRQFNAYAARDGRTQEESIDGTSDGTPYRSKSNLKSARDAVDFYLEQFPQAGWFKSGRQRFSDLLGLARQRLALGSLSHAAPGRGWHAAPVRRPRASTCPIRVLRWARRSDCPDAMTSHTTSNHFYNRARDGRCR